MKFKNWNVAMASLFIVLVLLTLLVLMNLTAQSRAASAQTAPPTATPIPPTVAVPPSPAYQSQAAATDGTRSISVSAVGQVQAAPDVAYLNVGSEVQAKSAREALEKARANGETIRKGVSEAGIPEKDIKTTGVSAYPITVPGKDGQPPAEPTGYRAYVNLSITINDLSKAGAALDAAAKAGANQVGGVSYAIKDDSALRAQALEQAVKQAKPKAEAIARGLNVQLGTVMTVVESPDGYFGPQYGGAGPKNANDLNPGQLTIGVRVTVSYSMK